MRETLRIYTIIFFVCLFGAIDTGYAQTVASGYTYEYWTRREGLPSNGVSDIASTGDGYIWLTNILECQLL